MMCTRVFLLCVVVVNYYTTFVISQQVCLSDECRNASQVIQNNLNTSVDPCEDMFQFVCGGWIQNMDIPEGKDQTTPFRILSGQIVKQLTELVKEDGWTFKGRNSTAVRKIKQFYKSCIDIQVIDQKGADPLKRLIDDYGSWTVTTTDKPWDRRCWSLQEALERAHSLTGNSFWKMTVIKDAKNSSRNILHIYQGGLTLAEHYFEYDSPSVRDRFMNIALTFGHLMGQCNKTVQAKMNQVYYLEKALSQIFDPPEVQRDPIRMYNLMNLTQFQDLIGPWIDVEKYFEAVLGNISLNSGYEIVVETVNYFSKLQQVIKTTNIEVLANYIMWNLIRDTMDYLPVEFSDIFNTNSVNNSRGQDHLHNKCMEKSKKLMPFVTSALYVDRHYSQELNAKIVSALEDIQREFVQNLNELSWLDDATKRNLTEKVEALTSKVGYPDWILDPVRLDAKYEGLVIMENEYFQNFLRLIQFESNDVKRILQQPPDNNKWYMYPHTVNAFYVRVDNEVTVLAGMLQEPIFSKNYPKSYLYGALGAILGHEIVHAFDSRGRHYDKDGNLRDIWTPHVAEEFNRRAQCFIDQYNRFQVYGQNISGLYTLGENMADNGGVKMAYRAYKSSTGTPDSTLPGLNLTNDRLFFVGFSSLFCSKYTQEAALLKIRNSPHAHGEFRVTGTLSNSREFSEAFNCSVNSPMNPRNKCEVW